MTAIFVFVVLCLFVICFLFSALSGTLLNLGITFLLYKWLRRFININISVFLCLVFSLILAANIRIVDYFHDTFSSDENVIISNKEKIKLKFGDKVLFSANVEEISYKRNLMEFPSKKFSGVSMSSYYSVPVVTKEVFRESVLNKGLVASADSNEKVSILIDVKSDSYLTGATYTLKNNGQVIYKKSYRIRKMYRGESEYFAKGESSFFDMLVGYNFWSAMLAELPWFLNEEETLSEFLDESIVVEREIKNLVTSEVKILSSLPDAQDKFRGKYWSIENVTHCDGFDVVRREVDIKGGLGDEQFSINNYSLVIPIDTFNANRVNLVSCKGDHFFIVDFFDWGRDRIEIYEYDSKGNVVARHTSNLTDMRQYKDVAFTYFEDLEGKFIVGFSVHEADEIKKQLYFELDRKK